MKVIWLLVILLIVVLAALAWVLLRTRTATQAPLVSREAPSAKPVVTRPASTWGKTVVVPDPAKACPAVLRIQGQSFANEAAPRLPLVNCTVANCQCRYVPAKERRTDVERRSGADRRSQLRFEPGKSGERRSGKDRRHRKGYDWNQTI